jgi:ABC-type uncharacterized transport system permease subunit
MNVFIIGLLILAAVSLGLRTTSFVAARVHPWLRLALAVITGAVLSIAFLQFCDSYRVFEFGLGLLISLSPVGLFDLAKWWFLWGRS